MPEDADASSSYSLLGTERIAQKEDGNADPGVGAPKGAAGVPAGIIPRERRIGKPLGA